MRADDLWPAAAVALGCFTGATLIGAGLLQFVDDDPEPGPPD